MKTDLEFKEHDPLTIPHTECGFCKMPMTQNEVNANVLMKANIEDYMCERCYVEANPQEFENL